MHLQSKLYETEKPQMFIFLILFCLYFQRNHSLFGNVLNALTGANPGKNNAMPNRSNSLQANSTSDHPALSPTTSLQHSQLSPQSSNDKTSPANSYLNVNYRNAKNRTPSLTTPNSSDGSRRMR